jgi:glyoxylase-like metal-dependent hydrolase (beta-lactamase superfamily II)/rhodanese-related sulfurtransferase
MDKTHEELQQSNKTDNGIKLVITAQELKSKLASSEPLMIFDIGSRERYEEQHIPGSACAVCNDDTKKSIMPRLPKNIELVIVSDDEEYPRQIADMMQTMGLKARYLQGGTKSWQWDMKKSESDRNISPRELKEILDIEGFRPADIGKTRTANTTPSSSPRAPFLLDVREREEFEQWSIEGSINIPLSELLSKQNLPDSIPKDRKIITICPHGNRSTIAKYFLERYGYNVSSLEGGLKAWSSTLEDVYKEIDISSPSNNNNHNEILKLIQIRRIGKGCISYILGSKGEAGVIDPIYPIGYYIQKASEMGVRITKVFDTHQHADHISAGKELAEMTGAIWYQSYYEQDQLSFSEEKKSVFPLIPKFTPLYDGDVYKIGGSMLKVIHTPGHTNGSISLLVKGYEQTNDASPADSRHHYFDKSLLLFTGDTLFVNGVGRPDLRDKVKEFAIILYETLHNRILTIGDNYNNGSNNNIVILPGHFDKDARAGELISTTLSKVAEDVELLKLPREEFIDKISSQVMPTPPNYRQIILINKGDVPILDSSQLHEIEMGPNRCSIS